MKNIIALCAISMVMALGAARVILMPKSLTPTMTMRQATTPFRSFTEFNQRRSSRRRRLRPIQSQCISTPHRTLSGFCNNRREPEIGAADTPFELIARPVSFKFARLPNPRTISNVVCEEAKPTRNSRGMSELVTFFGQLLDHTVTETAVDATKPLNVPVPSDDPIFTQTQFIPFMRTVTEGNGRNRSPLNRLSSYIDASSIYSVVEEVAKELRTMKGGRLSTPDGLLPTDSNGFFISGDERANENPNLTAMHLLFTREHNKVAEVVEREFPAMNDEEIYQLARAVVGAEFQAIVFFEFLPALTGRTIPAYRGYNERTRATISNAFSTVAFRVGHTLLNSTVTSISESGVVNNRMLRDSFFNPAAFRKDTIDGLMRGMMSGFASEVDAGITGEVRNFLVGSDSPMQLDLAALNIQRGRDHGVPSYNALRTFYGLPRVRRFNQITSDINLQIKLETAYNGDIDLVDPWVGGISEDRKVGSFGDLFARIWLREFARLRDGDRFYFEQDGLFTDEQIARIPMLAKVVGPNRRLSGVMRDIIIRNTQIPASQVNRNPFFV